MLSSLGRSRVPQTLVMVTRYKQQGTKNLEPVDPVQKLFVDKLREYRQKSAGSKLVDPSPAILNELNKEYDRLFKAFGGKPGDDMISFPTFKFEEPELDPIDEISPEEKKKKLKELEEKKKMMKK